MMRFAASLLFLLLVLSGCMKADEPVMEDTQPVVEDSINPNEENIPEVPELAPVDSGTEANSEESPDVLAALGVAETFVEAVRTRDADQLVQLLDDTMQSLGVQMDNEMAEIILEGFATNFDLNSLAVNVNKEGSAWGPQYGQYEFKLSDNRGEYRFEPWSEEDRLVILYDANGTKHFRNPYVNYFPYAEKMVSRYMEIIEAEDAARLAAFLNPDDIEVPFWVAEETISNYKKFLHGESPTIRYENRFNFVVVNENNEEHPIGVSYGAGLMGIRDEFIPEFEY